MKIIKRLFLRRMEEADLNAESAKAGTYFASQKMKGAPVVEQTRAANYFGLGFGAGIMWLEKQLGAQERKNGRPKA